MGCATTSDVVGAKTVYNTDAYVDRLGRVYLLKSDNTIVVMPTTLQTSYVFANNRRGAISDVDVTNPLKIIVYYQPYREIVLLDNTLSEVREINLDRLGYEDVKTVAVANDNNIWIYDQARYQLIKIDEAGQEIETSINLTELGLSSLSPRDIKEAGNRVYVTDPETGIVIFDNFGQYIKTLPIKGVEAVYVRKGVLIYASGGDLYLYDDRLINAVSSPLDLTAYRPFVKAIPTATDCLIVYRDSVRRVDLPLPIVRSSRD
jgi:outer membrane protein assembly factor BamB